MQDDKKGAKKAADKKGGKETKDQKEPSKGEDILPDKKSDKQIKMENVML